MESFTPISAAIGGALIGLSAVLLMAFHGRIAGISGVFSGAVFGQRGHAGGDRVWRVFFVVGLIAAPLAHTLLTGATPDFELAAPLPLIVAGGVLVGFGTRLGSGCTSGHGVCGISRLSPRSILATGLFMGAGMATVALLRPFVSG